MKKINKIVWIHIGILLLFYILFILCITKFQYVYGSNVDFFKQHATLPEYFRNLFYETGKLIPEFTLHLGSGENIFYYAYYGFLSPILLPSYLLPFLPMSIYIMIISIILLFISSLLIYYILRKNNFSYNTCFFASFLFLFSTSLTFHSHRHIMFVHYMPFLLLSLIGVHKYFHSHKSFLLILNIFLMILTSFYFSIPGILTVCIYALYEYLKLNSTFNYKDVIKFLFRIFLAIGASCFFLLPIFYIIKSGRSTNLSYNYQLFLPNTSIDFLMYGSYGVGLSAILWLSTIYQICKGKKENRVVALFLLFLTQFPIINLILNGGLYQNGKCFIPFLPLYILLIANTIETIDFKKRKWIYFLCLSIFLLKMKSLYPLLFIIDLTITLFSLYFYQTKNKSYYLIPILIISFSICIFANTQDHLMTIEEYEQNEKIKNYNYDTLLKDNVLYRFLTNNTNELNYSKAKNDYRITSYSSTTNAYYEDAFYNTFNNNDYYRNKFILNETNNLFFQQFMGVKYIMTNKKVPYGYEKIKSYEKKNLYQSENTFPIGYASSNLLNNKEFEKLSFNQQLEAFNNNIIISSKSKNANLKTLSEKIDLEYQITKVKNVTYQKKQDTYQIQSQENGKITLQLKNPIQDASLIIRFKMNDIPSCETGDTQITINGVSNKLTCQTWKYYNANETFDYILSSNENIDTLNITFAKGNYSLSDIEIYKIPNIYFKNNIQNIQKMTNIKTYTKHNILEGTIDISKDGYFLFTIPYDQGFEIKVDGQSQEYEQVNKAFLGFPIKKGSHKIELNFHAPFYNIGKKITIFSILFIGILLLFEKKSNTYDAD